MWPEVLGFVPCLLSWIFYFGQSPVFVLKKSVCCQHETASPPVPHLLTIFIASVSLAFRLMAMNWVPAFTEFPCAGPFSVG
jgi:hypothetical protein